MLNRESSDEILLDAMKEGDLESFNQLFDRYWQRTYAVVFSISRDGEVCADIVHDVFLNLWLKREQIQIECFRAYVFAAARYHTYRRMKRQKRHSLKYQVDLEHAERVAANNGDTNMRYKELERKVELHLKGLPKRCREIFTLSRMDQLSNDEIAERLDISKRTVENQLTHALHHLRISLKNLWVFLLFYGIQLFNN